jgi:hypothetical protein
LNEFKVPYSVGIRTIRQQILQNYFWFHFGMGIWYQSRHRQMCSQMICRLDVMLFRINKHWTVVIVHCHIYCNNIFINVIWE